MTGSVSAMERALQRDDARWRAEFAKQRGSAAEKERIRRMVRGMGSTQRRRMLAAAAKHPAGWNPAFLEILRRAEGQRLTGRPCRPHWWRMPVVGDDALECEVCGRRLRFWEDLTPYLVANITSGYARRHGPAASKRFASALNAAAEDVRRRKYGVGYD